MRTLLDVYAGLAPAAGVGLVLVSLFPETPWSVLLVGMFLIVTGLMAEGRWL